MSWSPPGPSHWSKRKWKTEKFELGRFFLNYTSSSSLYMWLTVIPSVPRAFCLIAMAMRFFSARVSLRAASIFGLTSACSLSASRRFSAKVPIPSSLDTCSSLCKLVIESVPISIYKRRIDDLCLYRDTAWNKNKIKTSYKSVTCVGGCRVARPRSSLRINGSAGRARNFFQTSASRLQNMIYSLGNHFKTATLLVVYIFN